MNLPRSPRSRVRELFAYGALLGALFCLVGQQTSHGDSWPSAPPTINSPAYQSFAVTTNDNADLPGGPCRAVYVAGGGNLVMALVGDSASQTWVNVPAGTILSVRARRIYATGTSATNLLALY